MDTPGNGLESVLKLEQLFFDHIKFQRTGNNAKGDVEINFDVKFRKKENEDIYRVELSLSGRKKEDYVLEMCIVGVFSFSSDVVLDKEKKEMLISKNTIAILMPYLRSEVSLVTSQPGMEPVVLPPFNVGALF